MKRFGRRRRDEDAQFDEVPAGDADAGADAAPFTGQGPESPYGLPSSPPTAPGSLTTDAGPPLDPAAPFDPDAGPEASSPAGASAADAGFTVEALEIHGGVIEPAGARLRGSRMGITDMVGESVAGVLARPLRTALTTLGTVLGVGALVATLGVSKTAGNQIVGRFNELTATQVVVEPAQGGAPGQSRALGTLPWDVETRIDPLNGVVAAGAIADVDVGGALVRSVPISDPQAQTEFQMRVVAASPGLVAAIRGTMLTGRFFDEGHTERADRVVVLGRDAAERLNITRVDNLPAIYIGEDLFTVIGIMEGSERERDLQQAVIVPSGTAADRYRTGAPDRVIIETQLGAAQLIASQAPIALDPNEPETLRVNAPRDPKATRQRVQSDVNSLFLVLGLVSLVVGAIGIANVTLVTVLERVGEIGLRRALGAARRHIALQFLLESTGIGFVGGIIGASAGILIVVGVSAERDWTPVLDAWVPLLAPVLGALVGLIAGLYPSLRAASLEPVDALRSGV